MIENLIFIPYLILSPLWDHSLHSVYYILETIKERKDPSSCCLPTESSISWKSDLSFLRHAAFSKNPKLRKVTKRSKVNYALQEDKN